jgi:hypothetical protein
MAHSWHTSEKQLPCVAFPQTHFVTTDAPGKLPVRLWITVCFDLMLCRQCALMVEIYFK